MDFKTILGIGFILLVIFLFKFLNNFTSNNKEENSNEKYKITPDNFKLRSSLMNSNERLFFEQLKLAVGNVYNIYPQVHLGAIFQPINYQHNWAEINKLNKKIDFVLFDISTQTPKIAIELDGESHSYYKSFKRDQFVEALFTKFNIPLIRFNNGNYSSEEIKERLSM